MSSNVDRVAAVKVFESMNQEGSNNNNNNNNNKGVSECTLAHLQTLVPPSALDMQLGSTRHRKQEVLRRDLDRLHRHPECTDQGPLVSWNGMCMMILEV